MRYAVPVAMPVGLGEWLGAELEARGVEAASLYARAVLSILLHSEVGELLEVEDRSLELLELRLERHAKETNKRGRTVKKNLANPKFKRSSNMATNIKSEALKRRPHSWNGDEEALKKCAAIECLLSATDDGQWGPVEKLVDELCARLKLLQMEQQQNGGNKQRCYGNSAPEFFEASDSDSFTSVSSPEANDLAESYTEAFPPLEYLSDSDQGVQQPLAAESIWNVRKNAEKSRVRFVRMPGTRLSPQQHNKVSSYGESEAYFGDCSRDSSIERTPPTTKGRLYERGPCGLDDVLDNAFKSFCQLEDWTRGDADNIWAPLESDWALIGPSPAVQLSLAMLNHHPERSGFSPVLPKSSKLLEWLANLAGQQEADDQVEILKEPCEEEENLLTSPKTHFCPIHEVHEESVEVSDGATFHVDAQPEEVHFLRSPSGALYLPDAGEENGWKGWSKYMVYKSPEPSPVEQHEQPSRSTTPFTLKFRVVQTEKCCQTESGNDPDKESGPLAISSPFVATFPSLSVEDVWKFDAEAITKQLDDAKVEESDGKEEVEGLLNEVWNVASAKEPEEFDLDELWNPFMEESDDICEWVAQQPDQWETAGGSWPPPNIPVEYLDDEFFEEIYGSLDKASSVASTKNGRRRRRRSSQKQPVVARRPKRPCSFFVEGECRRPDCKFSHDLATIPCRFWIESSCFKGEECPFLHGIATKESSHRSCSDAELSESCASEDAPSTRRGNKAGKKKFQFDLEADFPSLSAARVSQSRPIAITQGFAAADSTGSSLEAAGEACANMKRRRKRFPSQRVSAFANLAGTSSESSPGETVSINIVPGGNKRSRKVAPPLCRRNELPNRMTKTVEERRRTKSEHDAAPAGGSRLSSSYKEG